MPEQPSNSDFRRARRDSFAPRLACAVASLAVAACVAAAGAPAVAYAQSAAKPQAKTASKPTTTQGAKPKSAKVKTSDAPAQKPASSTASDITRARRAVTAAPSAAPAVTSTATSTVTPSVAPADTPATTTTAAAPADATAVAPATATLAVAPPVEKSAASAPENDAASRSKGAEAEVERLRAEIKETKASSAERTRLLRALVERLVKLNREPEALDMLRLMIHEDRFDPPFFFNTGNALARLGDASAAEDAYRKAIQQRRGNYASALNNLGVILIRQGHWDEAQQTFAAALMQENYAYAEASYNLGRLHLLRGETDLAVREWSRTLRLAPEHAEAAAALARAYAEDGEAKRGLLVLDNFMARSARAGTASVPREISEARRELSEAAGGAKDDGDTNAKTGAGVGTAGGRSSFRAREVDRATYKLLQTARERRERGSYEEAVKSYREVLARSPAGYFPPANLELGSALINLKRDAEAIAALAPLTEKEGARYPVAYYHLGRLYERQGELARAAQHFARAAELYGDTNPQVLIDLSRTRETTNDLTGALAAMNTYAAAIARQGTVPAWVAERQAKLKQKMTSTNATQSSTAKP